MCELVVNGPPLDGWMGERREDGEEEDDDCRWLCRSADYYASDVGLRTSGAPVMIVIVSQLSSQGVEGQAEKQGRAAAAVAVAGEGEEEAR